MRAYRVAYDGRPYFGFQRQPDVPTVEDTLFDALADLGVHDPDDPKPVGYAAAGRTDASVSAVAQTVAFDAPKWLTPRAVCSELPGDVRVWAAADVPDDFHATHDAARRVYRYHLHAPDASLDRARDAAVALSGEHDFRNLTTDDTGTVRDVSVEVYRDRSSDSDRSSDRGGNTDSDSGGDDEFLVLRVAAGGFPREFVRRLASVVRGVAVGDTDRGRVDEVLGAERLAGPAGIAAAPPEPLVLVGVDYPGVAFAADPPAVETIRDVFGERRVDGLVRARVARDVLDGVSAPETERG
ncbi:tRNA pseudouridine(38-40) synthase TruA [Halobaculum sp. D14]|uniref:tRNA pseudouridine(38-40) synthase TruA n=1 Tax=Halobaculum sp. D14 TaxID=3421642 RepID=UPI003EBB520F